MDDVADPIAAPKPTGRRVLRRGWSAPARTGATNVNRPIRAESA